MTTFRIGVLVALRPQAPKKNHLQVITHDQTYKLVYGQHLSKTDQYPCLLEGEPVDALYDRFPYQRAAYCDPLPFDTLIPIINPRSISNLCKDKWALQQLMETHDIPMPKICRSHFEAHLKAWKKAVAKPQFGSFGKGIQIVQRPPTPTLPSVVGEDPTLLQEWIAPPKPWAGICVRQLIQRTPKQTWCLRTPVARLSKDDPIVNAARGAQVLPAKNILPSQTIVELQNLSLKIIHTLSLQPEGEFLMEVGADFVIDKDWRPWFIEVNAQPRGKLKALAKEPSFLKEHHEILRAPFRFLCAKLQHMRDT